MAPRKLSATGPAPLLDFLLDPGPGRPAVPDATALGNDLGEWLRSVPRFRAFADAHRDKIRKKLRTARDVEALQDVRAELLVARLLLADRHLELAFEPGGAHGGPDFAVTHRGGRPMNLEVTRPRRLTRSNSPTRQILAKLHQLPAGTPNVLLLAAPAKTAAWDADAVILALRARADAKEEDYFTRRGFDDTRGFYDRFLRLGAILTWSESGAGADLWINRSARISVPARALRACLLALASR